MLVNNILYKIYKSGKIPVIRYKNEGFKNYNQDAYFTIDGKLDEKYKNINGCFCMLGGMQDPYILSGIENTETLNIGYIEADTKVYDVHNKTYTTAKSIFDKALNEYEKIKELQEQLDKLHRRDIQFEKMKLEIEELKAAIKERDEVIESLRNNKPTVINFRNKGK